MTDRVHVVLGDRVRCRITGFMGIAVARTDWIYGCVRWGVQREELVKDKGDVMEPAWFDDDQLAVVEPAAHVTPHGPKAPGASAPSEPSRAAEVREVHHHHITNVSSGGAGGPDRGESLDDPAETG